MSLALGIDFGVSSLRMSGVRNGKSIDISFPGGSMEFPIAAHAKGESLRVGKKAAAALLLGPRQGVASCKRFLGQREPLPFRWEYPYPLELSKKDTPMLVVGEKQIRLEEPIAAMLEQTLGCAKEQLGGEPDPIVANVPDHFSHNQRLAFLHACELAGFEPSHLLSDSLALYEGLQDRRLKGRRCLVVSMGAGYASVAVVSSQGKLVETLSSLPLEGIAGEDLDWQMLNLLRDEFRKAFGEPMADSPECVMRLLDAARTMREELSANATAQAELPYLMAKTKGPQQFSPTLRREDLERITTEAAETLEATCRQALSESRTPAGEVAAVLLHGGTARSPFVQTVVEALGAPVVKAYAKESLLAQGAAHHAATLLESRGVSAFEVASSNIFIAKPNREVIRAIPRRAPLPCRKEFTFRPEAEKWPSHMLAIHQGMETEGAKPPLLGTFPLASLTGKRDAAEYKVAVSADARGIVTVSLFTEDGDRPLQSIEEQHKRRRKGQDPAEMPVGTIIADTFKIQKLIGEGGFSFIYQVRNQETGETEALKILRTKHNLDAVVLERFRRSAEQILKIKQPNIARVFNFLHYDGMYIIEMEHVPGMDMDRFLDSDECMAMGLKDKVALLVKILEALRDLRNHRILHADLKPQNIMITPDHEPKLIDFELSKFLDLEPLEDEMVTGTPKYFSPEHLASKQSFGEHSDIYSVGLIGYTLLTGQFPKKENKPAADYMFSILELGKDVRPVAPNKVNRKIPSGLSNALVKAIRMPRSERFQTYEEMLSAIDEFA